MYEIHKLFSSSNLSKNLTAKEKKIKFLGTQKEENLKGKWGL